MTINYQVKKDNLEQGETSTRKGIYLELHLNPWWSKAVLPPLEHSDRRRKEGM